MADNSAEELLLAASLTVSWCSDGIVAVFFRGEDL